VPEVQEGEGKQEGGDSKRFIVGATRMIYHVVANIAFLVVVFAVAVQAATVSEAERQEALSMAEVYKTLGKAPPPAVMEKIRRVPEA